MAHAHSAQSNRDEIEIGLRLWPVRYSPGFRGFF